MTSFHEDHPGSDQLNQWGVDVNTESARLETARKIALESLEEDHRALELDAKLAFGPSAILGR